MTYQLSEREMLLQPSLILSFRCKDLALHDTHFKSEVKAIVWALNPDRSKKRYFQTERIVDSLTDPYFLEIMEVRFYFHTFQRYQVDIMQIVQDPIAVKEVAMIVGSCEFMLHTLVTNRTQELNCDLTLKDEAAGKLIIKAEESKKYGANQISFRIQGSIIDKSPMFFTINRVMANSSNTFKLVYRSECKKSEDGGVKTWNQVIVETETMTEGNDDTRVMIQVFRRNPSGGSHKRLATCYTNYDEIRSQRGETSPLELASLDGQHTLAVSGVVFQERRSLLDLLFSGCRLRLSVAIDLTLSNKEPSDPKSLHCLGHKNNQYTTAINAVASVLQHYDAEQEIRVYGFGCKIPGGQKVSHCVALNGDIFNPGVPGLEAVLSAYRNAVRHCEFYGPTHLAEVLAEVNAACSWDNKQRAEDEYLYDILLLLLDGEMMDVEPTLDQVVLASQLPLSIVVAGVGDGSFDAYEQLDADTRPLYSNRLGLAQTRDALQFVKMGALKNDYQVLLEHLLAEVPRQMMTYYDRLHFESAEAGSSKPVEASAQTYFEAERHKFLAPIEEEERPAASQFLSTVGLPVKNYELFLSKYRNSISVNPFRKSPTLNKDR